MSLRSENLQHQAWNQGLKSDAIVVENSSMWDSKSMFAMLALLLIVHDVSKVQNTRAKIVGNSSMNTNTHMEDWNCWNPEKFGNVTAAPTYKVMNSLRYSA